MIKTRMTYSQVAIWLFVLMTTTDLAFSESVDLYQIPKVLMLFFFVVMSLWLLFKKQTIPKTSALFAPLAFTFLEFCSCFWAVYPNVAISQMITQIQLTVLFLFVFFLFRTGDYLDQYIKAVYYAGFIAVIYLVFAYGLGDIVSRMLAGIRVGNRLGNENAVGMVFAKSALIAFGYLITKRNPKYLLVMAVMTFFAFSTGSRKAMLIVIVGAVAVTMFHYGLKHIGKILLMLIAICIAVVYIMKLPFMSSAAQRLIDSLNGIQDASAIERDRLISIGWSAIYDRPVLGYGISNFGTMYPGSGYSHNNFIEVLFSLGAVGFVTYYCMHVQAGIWMVNLLRRGADWRYVTLFVLLGINVVFGWGMVQFYTRESWVFLAVILATAERTLRKGENYDGDHSQNHAAS